MAQHLVRASYVWIAPHSERELVEAAELPAALTKPIFHT